MEIKTHIEKDKNKLPKHIIEFLHDGNKATFINGGQDSIRYEDFDIGMLKCGSIYWMSRVDNENKLYTIRHWGTDTDEEQKKQMQDFIYKCLPIKVRFSNNGSYMEYEA